MKRSCGSRVCLVIKRCDYVAESAPSCGLSKSYHGHQDYLAAQEQAPTETGTVILMKMMTTTNTARMETTMATMILMTKSWPGLPAVILS